MAFYRRLPSHGPQMGAALVVLAGLLLAFPVVGYVATRFYYEATTEPRCLAAGWRESRVTWQLERYCVTRNDQTDIVKSLEWAERNPR